MRFPRALILAALPVAAIAAGAVPACSTTIVTHASGSTSGASTGTEGTGGETGTSSTGTGTGTGTGGGAEGTGGGGTGGSVDIGQPSTTYPAPHSAPPQVANFGGPVLAAPKFYPVFFNNDDAATKATLKDFISKVGQGNYWKAILTEYGVGPGVAVPPIELAEAAPATIADADIQTWLAGKLNADDPLFGTLDPDAIITLHYPSTTVISLGGGGMGGAQTSCMQFGGYHSSTTLDAAHGTRNVAYAVIPRCTFAPMNELDTTTGSESHELMEASSDPYPMPDPAFASIDDAHYYWERLLGGGEIGDMCAQFPGVFVTFPELPSYIVQRGWSNKAAKAGQDPCVPAIAGSVYFNAAPEAKDTLTASVGGQMTAYKGTKIALGATGVVPIQLFSDAATGPWTVDVQDMTTLLGGKTPHLSIKLDATQGQNGQTLHASITVMTASKSNTESFVVISKLNGVENFWIGVVGQ